MSRPRAEAQARRPGGDEISRRELLSSALAASGVAGAFALGLGVGGCGAGTSAGAVSGGRAGIGSTLVRTWVDPDGTGHLRVGPGEKLVERTDLGPAAAAGRELARLVHLSDAHVMDAASPARVPFLARLGPPVQSTFRPQETLTAQVLDAMLGPVRAVAPDLVLQGGDLIDNAQHNELTRALTLLGGGRVDPSSGPAGYVGVQLASDPDPFYYRPDIDAPRHPGMLAAAWRPFFARGLGSIPWLPVLGDHDVLVAGELVPSAQTRALAVGDRALWELPAHLRLPDGFRLNPSASPDGPPDPRFVADFLAQALAGPTVRVPADPARAELELAGVVGALRRAARVDPDAAPVGERLDLVRDIGDGVRVIVLDLARRDGGSGGLVVPGQGAFLSAALAGAGRRWVLVVSHQPLEGAAGGTALLAQLDRHPRMLAALAGHIHRNRITPRRTSAGGYWLITTASLVDFPQQARALSVRETAGGGVVLETWMLDHAGPGPLSPISRELAYIDAQGGRPGRFAGMRTDRNVKLFRAPMV
ncbi:MAG TPA: hypothetical protein VFN48_06265 [Solirubrobacteraceae bacterium]|nr:hypothetical protein [Solirubrobacteraceae bacterium]